MFTKPVIKHFRDAMVRLPFNGQMFLQSSFLNSKSDFYSVSFQKKSAEDLAALRLLLTVFRDTFGDRKKVLF